MRSEDYRKVIFKDGPTGRRAALEAGPDVWEVVRVVREIDERGESAVPAAAEFLNLPERRIKIAMHYYADYPNEIDAEIEQNDREAEAALKSSNPNLGS